MDPIALDSDWRLRSSAEVSSGPQLSQPLLDTSDWYPAKLPATVLGTLVERGVYGDPFHADGFRKLPGLGPAHENFSNHPFPEGSPFAIPWWFRREFEQGPLAPGEQLWLHLAGINYRASLWLNGKLVADPRAIVGAYRGYDFCITDRVQAGPNALALEVSPPKPDDLALTWVDWNPSPPDKNMGLWRNAWLRRTGPLALSHPHVVSRLAGKGAELTLSVDVENPGARAMTGVIRFELFGQSLEREVELAPGARTRVSLAPEEHAALRVATPELWWPRRLGEQALHELRCELRVGGKLSDRASLRFGIREITSEVVDGERALFRVNGRPLLIRGGGWAGDLFQRSRPERERHEYEYVKHLGLNTIRFEGMLQGEPFLSRCDRDGMLVIAGFCCCDHWEKWANWKPEDHQVAVESLRSEIRRVRHHACMLSFWYGSDFPPPHDVEERYLQVLDEEQWPNPAHSSAAAKPTELSGPSGMKMAGPYDYVPPAYWLDDQQRGGAFGFATEISPGPAAPPIESLRAMLGEEHLWPPDDVWTLHAGGGPFKSLELFDTALCRRYGKPTGAADYARKAQLLTYEAERSMFEAFGQRKYRATGVIQWMLNNAWPSLIWHLWDWYLRPGGGYFGTKKACEPIHVQFGYDDRSVLVVSELGQPLKNLSVRARLLGLDARELWQGSADVDLAPDGVARAFSVPKLDDVPVSFLALTLQSETRELLSSNFYWLSASADVLDHERGTWYYTPQTAHADFSSLTELAPAKINARAAHREASDGDRFGLELELENPSPNLAFFLRLRLCQGEREVLPVFWDDNFLSLLPGEKRTIVATAPTAERGECDTKPLSIEISGWNTSPELTRVELEGDAHAISNAKRTE